MAAAHAKRRRRRRGVLATGMGVALVWGALGALGYIGGWQLHARRSAGALVHAEQTLTRRSSLREASTHRPCVVSPARTGQLAGVLQIPALHLTAPVEEGTTDPVLAAAVGHDPQSVWPGAAGTAALLAHDVSYFVHLDRLKAGDAVVYRTACGVARFTVTGSQVVSQGQPLPNGTTPTLVLDTCYPPNALFFTTQRFLVWATETGSSTVTSRASPSPASAPSYSVPAPAALVAQGLTLQQNEAPMGTMTLTGEPSTSWEQSPGPMALEAAALEAYFGGLHAMTQRQPAWWSAISAAGLPPPPALLGAVVSGHDAPLDVTIASTKGVPTEVVLQTVVTLSGGAAPGPYDETVTAAVEGTTVLLSGWTLRPA